MTVAYINADPAVTVFGTDGSSVHVQEILRALLKRGSDVHLFSTRFGSVTAEFSALRVHSLPVPPREAAPVARERALLDANAALHEQLEACAQEQSFDLVYERYSIWSFAAMEFALERRIPAVLEVTAPLLEEQATNRTLIDSPGAEEATMRAFRSASVIVTVSKELAHIIEQHPSARGKVLVVPNAVDPERFAGATPSLPRREDEFIIGFVGALKPSQGLITLLTAFKTVASHSAAARLVIVGDGPDREHLDREVAGRELERRVHFTGAVPPHTIPGLLAGMDVAVAPYPPLARFYLSPIKIFEFMAAGLPVVASGIGQIAEVIEHNVNGVLVPPGNAAALASALTRLETDPKWRRTLGAASRQTVAARHTWDRAVERIMTATGNFAPVTATFPVPPGGPDQATRSACSA